MLLYRYLGTHTLETLQNNLLKAATVSSLNDPFELLYRLTGTMTAAKYEREYRLITSPRLCVCKQLQTGEPADFFPFKREWVKCVDFGVRTSLKEIQTMEEFLQKEYPNVQLRKAVFHPSDYALDYEPV